MKSLIIDLKCHTLFFPEDVNRVKSVLKTNYHIYAIVLSDKFYINPKAIKKEKEGMHLPIFSPTKNTNFVIPFQIHEDLDHTKIKIETRYPHETFSVIIEDDDWKSNHPDEDLYLEYNITCIAEKVLFEECMACDFKVAYIGQSFGNNGERVAIDRLMSHSTLQNILADCQSKKSEYNVRILLLQFEQDCHVEAIPIEGINMLVSTPPNLSEKQIINITEAVLINYFKPEYNKDFISSFPSKAHTSYSELYDFGYTELVLDLSYLFEAENVSPISLFTDHNVISEDKNSIHYSLQNAESIFTTVTFDNI